MENLHIFTVILQKISKPEEEVERGERERRQLVKEKRERERAGEREENKQMAENKRNNKIFICSMNSVRHKYLDTVAFFYFA